MCIECKLVVYLGVNSYIYNSSKKDCLVFKFVGIYSYLCNINIYIYNIYIFNELNWKQVLIILMLIVSVRNIIPSHCEIDAHKRVGCSFFVRLFSC